MEDDIGDGVNPAAWKPAQKIKIWCIHARAANRETRIVEAIIVRKCAHDIEWVSILDVGIFRPRMIETKSMSHFLRRPRVSPREIIKNNKAIWSGRLTCK